MGQEEMKNMILMLLGMLAVIAMIGYFYYGSGFEEEASETACHDSMIYTLALTKQLPAGSYVKPWPSTCKTEEKVFPDKQPSVVADRFLELMKDCYFAMGEDRVEPFDKDVFDKDMNCFVCYIVTLQDMEGRVESSDVVARMTTKRLPDGRTYDQYLNVRGTTHILKDPLEPDKVYAVAYFGKEAGWVFGRTSQSGVDVAELNKVSGTCQERHGE